MTRLVPLAFVAALALGCASPGDRQGPLALGQQYTDWLYRGDHARLWARFGPELRRDFGSEDSLGVYLSHTVGALGAELGTPHEAVARAADTAQVYTRTASFAHAAGPMLLQWTLAPDGTISGFVLRPEPK